MPQYFQFWIVLITVPNLIVIVLMALVFALLILVPIPRHLDAPTNRARTASGDMDRREAQL